MAGNKKTLRIAGVDEAGRGPLAGPVYAAAVILPPKYNLSGLKDSKQLKAGQREALYDKICAQALSYAIGFANVAEIEQLNILQATFLAMQRAVAQLTTTPDCVWVDGHIAPNFGGILSKTFVKGDETVAVISAASILAKVARDRVMIELDQQYPYYGFAQHKGYGTQQHLLALRERGPCPHHRRAFAPVQQILEAIGSQNE
jgi:ribonuclease HII